MTLVCPFLGAGPPWLDTLAPGLVPPVGWMGGKRRLARDLLALLGLTPGCRCPAVLGDLSWWGWLWPVCLDPVAGPEVDATLRFWGDRDPRALWFWLRGIGPIDPAHDAPAAAAQLLWLQARAANSVPVWWEGNEGRQYDRSGRGRAEPMWQGHVNDPTLVQWAPGGIDGAGQSRPNAGKGYHKGGVGGNRGGGIVRTATVAERLAAIRTAAVGASVTIEHVGALDLTARWAPALGPTACVYLDPPYQDAPAYPAACPRDEVLAIAQRWAEVGARVVLSERVPLHEDLGPGWASVRLVGGRKPEWVTTYGCDVARFLLERPRAEQLQLFVEAA